RPSPTAAQSSDQAVRARVSLMIPLTFRVELGEAQRHSMRASAARRPRHFSVKVAPIAGKGIERAVMTSICAAIRAAPLAHLDDASLRRANTCLACSTFAR